MENPKIDTKVNSPSGGAPGGILKPLTKSSTAVDKQLDAEVRAYVYQKLSKLETIIPAGSTLNVSILPKGKKHIARIDAQTVFGSISSQKEKTNVFDAITQATDLMEFQLGALQQALANENEGNMGGPEGQLLH